MGRATWGTTNLKIRDTLYNSCYRAQAGVSPYNFSQSDYIRSSVDPFLYFGNSGSTNSASVLLSSRITEMTDTILQTDIKINAQIENAILNKAKKLKLSTN